MRQYEPIWHRIKTKNHASLVTRPANVARIIKAVIKEKHKDEGYKLQLAEDALVAKLVITQKEDKSKNSITINFSLTTSIKETYIGLSNL